jgi:hypothetical protein
MCILEWLDIQPTDSPNKQMTSDGIETVKAVKSWDAMGISDFIVTACNLNFMWGASR